MPFDLAGQPYLESKGMQKVTGLCLPGTTKNAANPILTRNVLFEPDP